MERAQDPIGEEIGLGTAKCCHPGVDGERVEEVIIHHLRRIEGRLKTFVEALTEDAKQCKAQKDIVRQMIWAEADELLSHIYALLEGGDYGLLPEKP